MLKNTSISTHSEAKPEGDEALKSQIRNLKAELSATRGLLDSIKDSNHHSQVIAFHEKFDLVMEANKTPDFLDIEMVTFRANFMQEELNEYCQAHGLVLHAAEEQGTAIGNKWVFKEFPDGKYNPDVDLEKCLDALIDLEYVLLGTVYLHGFSGIYDQAFARVQAANMSKVRAERPEDSKRGSGFDVVKPEGWEAPVFADLLDHAQAKE